MILEQFFNYYFQSIDGDTLKQYRELLPSTTNLAGAYADLFSRSNEEAIAFLLDFHDLTARLRQQKPEQAILFNVHNNICFPFFMEYIWKVISKQERLKIQEASGILPTILVSGT